MKKEEHIKYWKTSADHDLDIAKALFKSKKFDACLFFGHLALEKLLKAIWINDNDDDVPPFTHNLLILIEMTTIKISDKEKTLLQKINEFNIQARYPDYKFSFYKLCTKEFTNNYFDIIKGFYKWFKEKLR